MCCEPVRTHRDKQTEWRWRCACPGSYGILICRQNTSTKMNTDSCAGRAVHSGKSAGWENTRRWGGTAPLGWHERQAPPCCTCGFKGRAKPFIIALWFPSLAELSDWAEALGADLTSSTASGPRDFNTFVCFSPSVCYSAIWWVLDAQAGSILRFRQNCFLTNGSNLLYHLPHMCRAYRCFMRIFYDRSVLVIQRICLLEIY